MAGLMVGYLYWHWAWYCAHSRSVSARVEVLKRRTKKLRRRKIGVEKRAMVDAYRRFY